MSSQFDATQRLWIELGRAVKVRVTKAVNDDEEEALKRIKLLIRALAPGSTPEEIEALDHDTVMLLLGKMSFEVPQAMEVLITPEDKLDSVELNQRIAKWNGWVPQYEGDE